VPYAGSLYDNVAATVAKLKATMVSCGATTLRGFHEAAVLTVVSPASYAQNTAEVLMRDRPVETVSSLTRVGCSSSAGSTGRAEKGPNLGAESASQR
jgi:hypothetical protein